MTHDDQHLRATNNGPQEHEGNLAVRQGNWKLVSQHPGPWEVYDLAADRTEMNNLAGQYPAKVNQLADLYAEWAARSSVLPWQNGRPAVDR